MGMMMMKSRKIIKQRMSVCSMKKLIILFLFVFLISPVFALETLGRYEQNENVRITQVCSDATWINISSVSYPNSSVALGVTEMVSAGSGEWYYNYGLTSYLGKYDVRGISDGCEGTFATYFEITPDGFLGSTGFYGLILLLSLGIIVLGLWKQDAPITILGSFGLYFLGIYILFNGITGIRDPVYTWGIGLITLGLAFYISTKSTFELVESGFS